ncbi:hypothetical protein TanjilG_12123 [Lupinus angustifolius]|uniref:Uncharacterized protein n=1 Tax=Lupinus angustifolius TaxID=3871 RepID=A0A1J7GW82_LUPAN|nr:PREDICTED: uncharacterized protein LOC109325014 [Lupinus angustifolius]OIV98537.1 hypothetical protein TanjilG_12123 [Lupinus angustifolius]
MQTPISNVASKLRSRSGRTPLQPINSDNQHSSPLNPKLSISSHKTKPPIATTTLPDSTLAEELEAIKKRIERLRNDREITEKILNEREMILNEKMNDLEQRGEIQKDMEIQVDRLFRLKELKFRCMRVSPMRTLREKEQQKIVNQSPSPSKVKSEETVVASESESECREECEIQSPGSACSKTDTHTNIDKI